MENITKKQDLQVESVITDYLVKYCFPYIFDKFTRVTDLERQCKGIDIIADVGGWDENQDIKAQASAKYINHPLPTFAHELLYTPFSNKYSEHIGWWLDESLLTDTLVYVWIHSADVNNRGVPETMDDLKDIEVMFVDKEPLMDYLASEGCTKEVLLKRAKMMRKVGIWSRMEVAEGKPSDEFHLTYSPFLREQPVNLVIKKRVLRKFAYKHVRVTPQGVTEVIDDVI